MDSVNAQGDAEISKEQEFHGEIVVSKILIHPIKVSLR